MNVYSERSEGKLQTCHPDLIRLYRRVLIVRDHSIICGHRNEADQRLAFVNGYSKKEFPDSNHNILPSVAIDATPYPFHGWGCTVQFDEFAEIVKETADEMEIEVEWGYDLWGWDMPHWQLKNI